MCEQQENPERRIRVHTPLIAYLVLIIKLQRQIILILLAQLAEIFAHSRLPSADKPVFKRFNQFQVDEKVPLLQADIGSEALDYQQLIAESLEKNGKPILPVRRRKPISFAAQDCPRCSAPQDYLYANNGAGGQLRCKVCQFKFQDGHAEKNKTVALRCPYCQNRLSIHNRRTKFDV